jgi:multidrug efflux pump subunit AcrA (membrane-fusion protein)
MNKQLLVLLVAGFSIACRNKVETITPTIEPITESVYASGIIKSNNQYQVFATVSGIIGQIFVNEGDTVSAGTPLLSLLNETSRLNTENAQLAASYADFNANKNKLNELRINIEFARIKVKNDSLQYMRQKGLWAQQVGSQVELEQRELAYQNSQTAYKAALLQYDDLNKQLKFASQQSKKNLAISQKQERDFTVRSEISGRVYTILKKRGEMINSQTPLAVVGDANGFMMELQVDEYDIVKVQIGQTVVVRLDSYRNQTFEAKISRIDPIMNERSKTFLVEAIFTKQPPVLYPNLTVEANIVISENPKALTIPRVYLINDSIVKREDGTETVVKVGLKDYQKAEILSGLTTDDKLIKP